MPRAPRALRWYLPPLLLAVSPVLVIVGANLGVVPLRGAIVARSLAVAIGGTVVVLSVLRLRQRDLAARAAWLSWFLILCSLYWPGLRAVRALGLEISERDPYFALPFVVSMAALAAVASRPWEVRPRDPRPFTAAGGLLIVAALAPAAAAERPEDPLWRQTADAMIAAPLSKMAAPPSAAEARDIYYIVLDGLGRADTVKDTFKLDLEPLADALRAKDFHVPGQARTNYSQTYLSLASTLNLTYLDELVRVTGTETKNRTPLYYLIQQNALMRMASRAGYDVTALGSNFRGTKDFAVADTCICSRSALDEMELAVIGLTPLAALRPPRWADPYTTHRQIIDRQFEGLRTHARGARPSFVFAHVLAPHPPFIFTREGRPRRDPWLFTIGDGLAYGGSHAQYVSGYANQAEYILRRTIDVIDTLLRRPGPAPVIVVHGDHGPDSVTRWQTTRDVVVRDRMAIFAAYHFPDGPADLSPALSPVNGARLVARYLGAELPMLGDTSFFADWSRPYTFLRVPSEQAGGDRARQLHEDDGDRDATGAGQERRPE
jgi:hypothetical protein